MKSVALGQIVEYLECTGIDFEFYGDRKKEILGFSSFEHYRNNTITWVKNIKKYQKVLDSIGVSVPACIIIDKDVDKVSCFSNKFVCNNPKYVFALVLREFFADNEQMGSGQWNVVSEKAVLHPNTVIGSNCIIEDDVSIGSGTLIYHNVVIRKGTVIGKNCVIKSGTVLGEEGYGYSRNGNHIIHMPHFGHVILEDEVEIGSNCSIDRGTIDNTVIGKGSKIDNLCHIAHNVQIGRNVMIVAGSVICGSVHIRDGAYIAPGAVIKNQIEVGEGCIIGLGSVVLCDAEKGAVLAGIPAKKLRDVGDEDL